LLRTAPDGEGNWFYEGTSSTTRLLRLSAKHKYTRKLIRHMLQIIRRRHLPLLVDIGGRPQGEQWDILYACTHGILLHRDPSDLDFWMPRIRRSGLNLLAILESRQRTQDEVIATEPYLQGVISGLERENPHPGRMFELLLEQVETLCAISEEELEALHRQTAPYDMLSETQLARALNKTELPPWWHPEDLTRLVRHLPQQPFALYVFPKGGFSPWLDSCILFWTTGTCCPHPFQKGLAASYFTANCPSGFARAWPVTSPKRAFKLLYGNPASSAPLG